MSELKEKYSKHHKKYKTKIYDTKNKNIKKIVCGTNKRKNIKYRTK